MTRNIYIDSSGNAVNSSSSAMLWPFLDEEEDAIDRSIRMRERRERARELLKRNPPPPPARKTLEKLDESDLRKLGWFSGGGGATDLYSSGFFADPSQEYDKWAQGYRMLGAMIDCDHIKQQGSHDGGDRNKNNNNNQNQNTPCSRWMLWAAYVNPNYQGGGYDEYYGDEPASELDCHNPNSEWQLLGVYRQEFYQFIEQISKHLWAIDDYEYVVALAGLSYMSKYDCFKVGSTSSGTTIYAGVAPQAYGKFQMALYTDSYCLTPDTSLGMTYDDFGMTSNINLGSKDQTGDDSYSWAQDWWTSTQEYTLTNLNDVYEEYKYCTTCVDYPTYQDGYFIGNDGTDDDDLINQCWKFYSHNSYTCDVECVAKAHAQGTILSIDYGDAEFGKSMSGFYEQSNAASSTATTTAASTESPLQRLMANAALTASFLLFVATFLAFAVARRSRFRDARSTRTRRLLEDEDEGRSRRSRRSQKSDGDGLIRMERSSGASKSKKSRSKSRSHSATKSSRKQHKRSRSYDPPKEHRSKSDGRSGEEYH